jgi:hypothetical protein
MMSGRRLIVSFEKVALKPPIRTFLLRKQGGLNGLIYAQTLNRVVPRETMSPAMPPYNTCNRVIRPLNLNVFLSTVYSTGNRSSFHYVLSLTRLHGYG